MKIMRAFKTELDLNNGQTTACIRHAGAARFAYNWGLARKKEAFANGQKTPTAIDLHRELNGLKKTELSWMYEVSKCAPQEALRDLDNAFVHFFRRVKEKRAGKNVKVGFPRFKSKKSGLGSFRLTGVIHVFENTIQLPRLGVVRLKERGYLPTSDAHILSATVSEKAGRWFVSLQVAVEVPDPVMENKPVAGVDLGINRMAQVSDGTYFDNPRPLKSALTQLKRLQRVVSRREVGTANYQKAVKQLAKAHFHVTNIRRHALHQATTSLTKTKSAIVLENLNVSGMMKNHHLAQAIADVGMYEFRRQLQYKGQWYGCAIVLADRFFPSTKRCSQCGSERCQPGRACVLLRSLWSGDGPRFECSHQLGAVVVLLMNTTASSAGRYACGEHVRPDFRQRSRKQEPNINLSWTGLSRFRRTVRGPNQRLAKCFARFLFSQSNSNSKRKIAMNIADVFFATGTGILIAVVISGILIIAWFLAATPGGTKR